MDYLSKALEDGIVDSPPTRAMVLIAVILLLSKAMAKSSKSLWRNCNGAQHNMNLKDLLLPNYKLHMG